MASRGGRERGEGSSRARKQDRGITQVHPSPVMPRGQQRTFGLSVVLQYG